MKLFGINFGKDNSKQIQEPTIKNISSELTAINFYTNNTFLPEANTYYSTRDYIKWGDNNLFPHILIDLYNSSPIHAAIIDQKSKSVIGEGFRYNDVHLTAAAASELNRFLLFTDGENDLETVCRKLSFDYQLFGIMFIEVIWNADFTKIVKLNRIPAMHMRLGEENERGKIENFYYSKDWKRNKSYTKIPAFNILNKTSTNQILCIKNDSPDGRAYGQPSYSSTLQWVYSDSAISKFHASNITNGFNPSVIITLFGNATEEQNTKWENQLKNKFAGQNNAGRHLLINAPDLESAPLITPYQTSELDRQFSSIASEIVGQIIRGHRAVSPILWAIREAGQLGSTDEFMNAYKIFEYTVVQPDRKIMETVINRLLKINYGDIDLTFIPNNPFKVLQEQQTIKPAN